MVSRRDSTHFKTELKSDFDEVKQSDLISRWLENVQSRYHKVLFEGKTLYLNREQVNQFKSLASNPVTFRDELKAMCSRKFNPPIQNGDHLFMRVVKNGETGQQELVLELSGDHVLETVDARNEFHGVPFLLDYTRRWSSRIEYFSGAIQEEIPLIFASFQFFCSTPMLLITIFLLVYIIIGQLISAVYFNGIFSNVYQNVGLLISVVMGSLVVKGSLGAAAFENAAMIYVAKKMHDTEVILSRAENVLSARAMQESLSSELAVELSGGRAHHHGSSLDSVQSEIDFHNSRTSSFSEENVGKVRVEIPTDFPSKLWAFGHVLINGAAPSTVKARELSLTGRKIRANGLIEGRGFVEVLEVATEYLKLMSTRQNSFKARVYSTYLLRGAYLVVPGYVTYSFIHSWVNVAHCYIHRHYYYHTGNAFCTETNFTATYTLGFTLQWLSTVLGILNLVVSFSILMYSTDVANALTKYWLHRFRDLRRISALANDEEAKDKTAAKPEISAIHALETVQPLIERDAFERYLFTHTYFSEASSRWSLYLFACMAATFVLALQSYLTILYLYAKYQYISPTYTLVCVLNVLIFTTVFACMAYANGAVDKIKEGFLYAGANDYALMGGRSAWLEYVDQAPIYWYIFGFAIKRSDVISYIGGLVSAVIGGVVISIAVG